MSLGKVVSERIMCIHIRVLKEHYATILSIYKPTMTHTDEVKEAFYEDLDRVIRETSWKDKLFILGDFNVWIGCDSNVGINVIDKHGIGKANANVLLLELCRVHNLVITNTIFQGANKNKTSWMHPRSKQWHILYYLIVQQRDVHDIKLTRSMRDAECWIDHRLVRSKTSLAVSLKIPYSRLKPSQHCRDQGKVKIGENTGKDWGSISPWWDSWYWFGSSMETAQRCYLFFHLRCLGLCQTQAPWLSWWKW